jgi:hypothetical protein
MLFHLRNSSRFDAADHSRRRRGKERRHSYGNKNACRRQAASSTLPDHGNEFHLQRRSTGR